MQVSPCLNPVRTYNESLGTYIHVPCGKCAACVASKGFSRKQVIMNEIEHYKIKVFVTLTYNDEHLPLAIFDGCEYISHQKDVDYNGELKKLHLSKLVASDYEFYWDCVNRFGGLPVLSHRDMILFRKRLRNFLNYESRKQNFKFTDFYAFTVGEYGSQTFRPHYHILFGLNEEREFAIFEQCVRAAWSDVLSTKRIGDKTVRVLSEYGQIDFQRCVDSGSIGYVAQYLSCVTQLPNIYQSTPFRPFSQKSAAVVRNLRNRELPSLRKFYEELPVRIFVKDVGSSGLRLIDTPKRVQFKYFPKFPGIDKVPECYWYRCYSIYFRYKFTAKEFANLVLDSFVNCAFLDSDVLILKFLYYDKTDLNKVFNNLIRFFYAVRRLCLNCLSLGVSVFDYCNRMVKYYSKVELYKLRKFYTLINDLTNDVYNPCSLSQVFSLYYDTDSGIKNLHYYYSQFGIDSYSYSYRSIPCQANYASLMHKIIADTTKTKKRNSHFAKHGYKRPVYYPFVNKKYIRFL